MGSKVSVLARVTVRGFSRTLLLVAALTTWVALPRAHAASAGEALMDAEALSQLEARAAAAQPKEQCFLYAELVHQLTETAGKELADGKTEEVSATLKHIDSLAAKIHVALARDTKRLKNAEMLLHNTSRRLFDMLHAAPSDSRETLQSTLKRLEVVQSELLTQVFEH